MANAGLTTALVFMCMVTLITGLSNLSINNISTQENKIFGCGKLFQEAYTTTNLDSSTDVNVDGFQSSLPGSATTEPKGTSGFFVVDWIASTSNWMATKANTFSEVALGPYCLLHSSPDIPNELVTMVSAMWYTIMLLLFAAFIFGR